MACALICKFKILNVFILDSSCCCASGIVALNQAGESRPPEQCSPALPQAGTEPWDGDGYGQGNAQSRSAAAPAAHQVLQSPQANVTSSDFNLQGSRVRPLLKVLEVFCSLGWE